jgi:hypothetical protein
MKKYILFDIDCKFRCSKQDAYDAGEWFKFRIHYGIVNAGCAEVKDAIINNKKKSSMLWVRLYDRYVSFFFSKWMTCMKVISIRNLKSSKICKEDQ